MAGVEQIRILRVQGRAEGMEVVTAALERVAGATVKVTTASDGMSAATEAQSRKVLSLSRQWETYQSRTDMAARASQVFGRDITLLTRFYEQGTIGASRYAAEVEKVKSAFSSAGVAAVVPKIDQSSINDALGIRGSVEKSAKEAAGAFEQEFARLETIARQRAEQIGANFQIGLNEGFGVGAIAKSARDSAAVFSAELDRIDDMASQKAAQIGRNFQDSLNQSFGIGGGGAKAAGATFSALEAELTRLDTIATAKSEHIAQVIQRNLGDMFGMNNTVKSARASADAFEEVARAEEEAGRRAAQLRADIDPLGAEFARLGKQMAQYRKDMQVGLIGASEFEQAQLVAGKRLSDFEQNLKKGANAGRVMSGELVNLSYQLNDVVTGLLLGQSPFMIFAQQGGQVFQIFQNSKASVIDFAKEAGSKLLSFMTVGRVAFAGVSGAAIAAGLALNDYLGKQEEVRMGLTGAGRASGSTLSGINNMAESGSSPTGLSVAEARRMATALASTGKVANDNILPIVQMGKDIAKAFGTDAAGAAEMLAKSFADPVQGAEDLNRRLGFMDAAMQRQIANLVAQNRLWDAQKLLTAGVQSSLADVNAAVGTSTKFWTAFGNAISNVWDKVGEGASRFTGIGLRLGIDEQIDNTKKRIAELEQLASRRSEGVNRYAGTTAELEKQRAKLTELTEANDRYSRSTIEAQQRQFSFAQAAAVRNQMPEIDQLQSLRNEQEKLVKTLIDVQTTGGPASDILKRMGVTYEELAKAVGTATGNLTTFKNEFEAQKASLDIANRSITAFSPGAKGEVARQQSLEATRGAKMDPAEKEKLSQMALANAVKQSVVAISEAARQRALTADQSVKSAQNDVAMVGQMIGKQAEMRANLQARQQLEQEASQNRTKFDQAKMDRLEKINEKLGKQVQLAATAAANDNINFGAQTAFLSPEDAAIASQLRGLYPDVASGLRSVQAAGIQTNSAISGLTSTLSGSFSTSLTDIVDGTKSISAGAADMGKAFIRALEEMIIKITVIQPMMRALQMTANSFGFGASFLGGGASAAGTVAGPVGPSSLGGMPLVGLHSGGIVGSEATFKRSVDLSQFANAPRFHTGGIAGDEVPIIARRGEGVFTEGQMRAMGSNDNGRAPNVTIINQTGTKADAEMSQDENGDVTIHLRKMVESIGVDSIAGGDMGRAMESKYGLKRFAGG